MMEFFLKLIPGLTIVLIIISAFARFVSAVCLVSSKFYNKIAINALQKIVLPIKLINTKYKCDILPTLLLRQSYKTYFIVSNFYIKNFSIKFFNIFFLFVFTKFQPSPLII